MNIPRLILKKLRENHIGRNRAIKRNRLLDWLYLQGAFISSGATSPESEDRKMRAIIEKMPIICSCESGYYLAREGDEGYEDVKYALSYISKKAMPLLVKIRRKKEAYPQFYKGKQMGLSFEEIPYEEIPHEDEKDED